MRPLLPLAMFAAATVAAAQTPDSAFIKAVRTAAPRSIGPALMGGRVQDIAVDPRDRSTWYIGVGSGGVWKTTNAGVTFTPLFDDQPSYSIGEITLDPSNPDVVWVGTGENVSGRHVGWGSGVYRSRDGGRSWKAMGLANSQHIARILVDPRRSDVVLVAAEGPLWSAGGERGVYRSTDGGATWSATLTLDENTGVTDLEFDPSDPDVLYAAAYQRRRHVWGFMGGGPKSGIWKSTDNGKTWRQLTTGLPSGDLGKIGLAVTPADPRRVYATIEARTADASGLYRSDDRGESWTRKNGYISGGTGPHYYQELEASPVNADVVWQMDVFLHATRDGGATMPQVESGFDKHSDNHALWIDPTAPRHLLVGTDGGLYESFDEGATWRHFPNLPIAQLYKVAVNDRAPFFDILAGAQDLGTFHGPSRTLNRDGVRNQDWYVPLGADGYGVAFASDDPDQLYIMYQEGMLYRNDRRDGENVFVRPMPAAGDPPERWNWDAPLATSPHAPARLYYGSQRVWRSDDRGASWTAISSDLTLNKFRYAMPFFGRTWSVDALHHNGAQSKYATTTAISESPRRAGALAVGTDDGVVQVTLDAGATWTRAATPPGLPALSLVNDVEWSVADAATLYVAADNHKQGDFAPYLYESTDAGRSWRSIAGDLPKGAIVWAIQQDAVRPSLLFAGTEQGVFVTADRGVHWVKLGGLPTIPVRDLKLQRRDGDLVMATFGRGIYVLDDIGALRVLAGGVASAAATVLPVRDAWWYVPTQPGQAPGRPELGTDDWTAPNPPHGALLRVLVREPLRSRTDARRATEQGLDSARKDVPFPGWETLFDESTESEPRLWVRVTDAAGATVRWLAAPGAEGVHTVAWDLRGPQPDAISLAAAGPAAPWDNSAKGPLVAPGRYGAQTVVVSRAGARAVGEVQRFEVKPVPNLPAGHDPVAVAAFQARGAELIRQAGLLGVALRESATQLKHWRAALAQAPKADPALHARIDAAERTVAELRRTLQGDEQRGRLDENAVPSVTERLSAGAQSAWETRHAPTVTQQRQVELATAGLAQLRDALRALRDGELARLSAELERAGAPATPGVRP